MTSDRSHGLHSHAFLSLELSSIPYSRTFFLKKGIIFSYLIGGFDSLNASLGIKLSELEGSISTSSTSLNFYYYIHSLIHGTSLCNDLNRSFMFSINI